MTAISGSGRFLQPNLLAEHSERVFLCPQFRNDRDL
jgi:hypothetical protein